MRKTFAEINLKHLKYNFLNIRKKIGSRKVLAVVKADAYGHGMIKCVEAFETLGVKKPDYYGVALTEEAVLIRKSKITKQPILTFSPFDPSDIPDYIKYRIIPTISDKRHINQLNKLKLSKKLKVHVNIDTGMGRTGLRFDEAVKLIAKLVNNPIIVLDGIYTHFACSDEKDKTYSHLQLERFIHVIDSLRNAGIKTGIIHAANSGAIMDLPQSYFDMVRPGISLYGYYPSLETSESVPLKPVMSLYSHIVEIRDIKKGESVSYGRIFTATKDMKVFSVPIGYADGYNRNLSNQAKGIVRNNLVKQIGRVTMDRILFDPLSTNVKPDDKIILLGNSKDYTFDAWDWAKLLNTIPYEITCNISKRVPRIYKG